MRVCRDLTAYNVAAKLLKGKIVRIDTPTRIFNNVPGTSDEFKPPAVKNLLLQALLWMAA
jgi:hypothetical protein